MAKSVAQLINELQRKGIQVTYRRRSDRGILITSINGKKFTGAKGNIQARDILGEKISSARQEQLQLATRHKRQNISARTYTDKDLERIQRRINRKRRKNKVQGGGIITKSKIRYNVEQYGKEEAFKKLQEQERYTEGLAYTENVKDLIQRFENLYNKTNQEAFNKCADLIRENAYRFKEEWIQPIYYDWIGRFDKHEISAESVYNGVKMIIQDKR